MARIRIQDVLEHLQPNLHRALASAIRHELPEVEVDTRRLFRQFVRDTGRKCAIWENVPDQYIEQ